MGGQTIPVPDSSMEVQRSAFTRVRGTVSRVPRGSRWSGFGLGLCLTPTLGTVPLWLTSNFRVARARDLDWDQDRDRSRDQDLVKGQGLGCAQARG